MLGVVCVCLRGHRHDVHVSVCVCACVSFGCLYENGFDPCVDETKYSGLDHVTRI